MQIKELLYWGVHELAPLAADNRQLEARLLLEQVLDCTTEQLLLKLDQEVESGQIELYKNYIKRRTKHEPIAYILGYKEFYGRKFLLNTDVLIPRPETELLIDLLVADVKYCPNQRINILDLGTGSGVIAITAALEVENAFIIATDTSKQALEIAAKNANNLQVSPRVDLLHSDWYQQMSKAIKFDYIISNPPYIDAKAIDKMASETILYEPELALYAADQGLHAYQKIISQAAFYLQTNGKLILEIGFDQSRAVTQLLTEHGFKNISCHQDLAGHDRCVIGSM